MNEGFNGNFPYRSRSSASGCCLLGLVFAAGAILWYATKWLFRATIWFMRYFLLATYYVIASPFLLIEYLWRQGGVARTLGLVFTALFAVFFVFAALSAPRTPATTSRTATAVAATAPPVPAATATIAATATVAATTAPTDVPTAVPTVAATSAPVVAASATAAPATETPAPVAATETPAPAAAAPVAPAGDAATLDPATITDDTRVPGRITRTVDGDTVRLDIFGKNQSARLIGVDTPETVDRRKAVQCYGREASAYTKKMLTGMEVTVSFDVSQGVLDKYERPLVYIWLADGTLFNKQLIADGYAFEYTYNTPYRYQAEFQAAERDARSANRGLWAPETCNGVASAITPTP